MKINRRTFLICALLVVACVSIYFFSAEERNVDMLQDLFGGIATGAFVSVVVALVGYFHEREVAISQAADVSVGVYFDLAVLTELLGYTLNNIDCATRMQDLPFRDIVGIARSAFENYSAVSSQLFDPFFKGSNLAKNYSAFVSYRSTLQHIVLIARGIEAISMQIDIDALQAGQISNNVFQPVEPTPVSLGHKKILLVKMAKLHEHVTDRTMQYEVVAQFFANRTSGKEAWENARKEINCRVAEIMSSYTIRD